MIFTGTYERNLDDKGRLSLPAALRKELCSAPKEVVKETVRESEKTADQVADQDVAPEAAEVSEGSSEEASVEEVVAQEAPKETKQVKDAPDSVYVFPALDVDALYVFSEENYEAWLNSLFENRGGYDPRSSTDTKLRRYINAKTSVLTIDKASRISLPQDLREKKHIDSREVTLVGNGDHLEIWDRETWNAAQDIDDDELLELFFS